MQVNLYDIQSRIAAGDEKALAELYHLYHKKLQLFAKSLVRSQETAEELVEDVFMKLWQNRETILSINDLMVYLYVAVKNRSLNALSQQAKRLLDTPFDDSLEIENSLLVPDPHSILVTNEMMQSIWKAIEALPPRCKMIFKLVREDGLSYKAVAEILGIAANTVDVQIGIALKKISASLQLKKSNGQLASITSKK
jgi:RNA polymerase sigma-70 factor (family 1)